MFILYFALWVILNGKWTIEIGVFGVVFAALLYAFSCRFMGYSVKTDLALLRGGISALRYGVTLLGEIVKANLSVMRMILDKRFEPKPQLVRFESGLSKDRHRVALANSITLTPGTITCHLEGDDYVVHCLDESLVEGLQDGPMAAALKEMERREQEKREAQETRAEAEELPLQEEAAPQEMTAYAQEEGQEDEH